MIDLRLVSRWMRRQFLAASRLNPYVAGTPVFDHQMFFGRRELAKRVIDVLRRKSVRLVGECRIGKTSLLRQIERLLAAERRGAERFFPVFVDLEGVSERGLFHTLTADIVDVLAISPPTAAKLRFRTEVKAYGAASFRHDFPLILRELRGRTSRTVRVVALIDEADALGAFSDAVRERFCRTLTRTFAPDLVAVLSTAGAGGESRPTARHLARFERLEVGPLTREQAADLVRVPVAGIFRYERKAVERILELSDCKPHRIQTLCRRAIDGILETGRTTIRVADVEAARRTVVRGDAESATAADPCTPSVSRPSRGTRPLAAGRATSIVGAGSNGRSSGPLESVERLTPSRRRFSH